jgi:hypothetical protein
LPQRAENAKTLSKKKYEAFETQTIFWRLARVGTPLLTGCSLFRAPEEVREQRGPHDLPRARWQRG